MRVFIVALLTSYALLVTAMVFLGLTLIYVVLPTANLDDDDEHVSRWLADHRTSDQEHLSWIGSTLAGGLVIPVVIGLCLLVFVISGRWLLAAFVVFAGGRARVRDLSCDLADRRARPPRRPPARRAPVDASYPSGHTAASIALYGGLLLLLCSRIRNRGCGSRRCSSASRLPSSWAGRVHTGACTTSPMWARAC